MLPRRMVQTMRPTERGVDVPQIGERLRIGDVTVLVTHVRPWQEYDRTVVICRDDNGEDVELRFIPDKQWEDDA